MLIDATDRASRAMTSSQPPKPGEKPEPVVPPGKPQPEPVREPPHRPGAPDPAPIDDPRPPKPRKIALRLP